MAELSRHEEEELAEGVESRDGGPFPLARLTVFSKGASYCTGIETFEGESEVEENVLSEGEFRTMASISSAVRFSQPPTPRDVSEGQFTAMALIALSWSPSSSAARDGQFAARALSASSVGSSQGSSRRWP